ncbi:unnamed protein product, partial [Rotaria sp. Silwood1]
IKQIVNYQKKKIKQLEQANASQATVNDELKKENKELREWNKKTLNEQIRFGRISPTNNERLFTLKTKSCGLPNF